jgi:hypothetical protein
MALFSGRMAAFKKKMEARKAKRKENRSAKRTARINSRTKIKGIKKDDTYTKEQKKGLVGVERAHAKGGMEAVGKYSQKMTARQARRAKVSDRIKARKDARAAKKDS